MAKNTKIYTQKDIEEALKAVENGISIRQASLAYSVPRTTLYCKHKNINPISCKKGPATILSTEDEKTIKDWIFYCCDRGFPVTKTQLLDSVQSLIIQQKIKNPFTDDRPGRHWFEAFFRRHPELSHRIAQNLSNSRASVTEQVLRKWFSEVILHITRLELVDIDASRVFNCDESAFFLCPKAEHVIARKGSRSVYKVINGSDKESLTVLFTISATGILAPPMVLYWYERMPTKIKENLPTDWIAATTDRGWMTAESFYEYVANGFHRWLERNRIQRPVILYVDGHSSHLTLPVATFCRTHGIELIALYPNATHILQPLDVAVFHPLKSVWRNVVDKWRLDNAAKKVTKENFAHLLKTATDNLNLVEIAKNGFAACGLYPLSADAVNYNILNRNKRASGSIEEENIDININTDLTTNIYQQKCKYHTKFLEDHLDKNVLQDLRNAEFSGSSPNVRNQALFDYWMKIKTLSEAPRIPEPAIDACSNEVYISVEDVQVVYSQEDLQSNDVNKVLPDATSQKKDIPVIMENVQVDYSQENEQSCDVNKVLPDATSQEKSISVIIEDVQLDYSQENEQSCDVNKVLPDATSQEKDIPVIMENVQVDYSQENEQSCDVNKVLANANSQEKSISVIIEDVQLDYSQENEQSCDVNKVLPDATSQEKDIPVIMENVQVDYSQENEQSCDVNNVLQDLNSNNVLHASTQAQDRDDLRAKVPSPFKDCFFWPQKSTKKSKLNKENIEKVPCVATSDEWLAYFAKKEDMKAKMEKEKQERKEARQKLQLKKAEEREQKKLLVEEKKRLSAEKKKLLAEKKSKAAETRRKSKPK